MNFNQATITFIGAGNMATALIQGLITNGVNPANIWATDPDPEKLSSLKARTEINTTIDNQAAVEQADIVVLAVKPQVMAEVLAPLQACFNKHSCLLVSIAAGIELHSLQCWTNSMQAIVRCMPNTPALVQAGASALFANEHTTTIQKYLAETLLSAVGSVCWLAQEKEIDAVTALSGSGPAYFFLLMEAMEEAAIKLGLDSTTAQQLCLQTAFGAASLARESDTPVAELRRRVTSPGGTTEAALNQFAADDFKKIVQKALNKAAYRSEELSRELGKT